jgi:hypothetical protein
MHEVNLIFPDNCLPQDTTVKLGSSKEAVKTFNTIVGIYNIAIQALKHLKNGELQYFDSLATDCSCHLRALEITAIYNKFDSYGEENQGISLNSAIASVLRELKDKKKVIGEASLDIQKWNGGQSVRDGSPIVAAITALRKPDSGKALEFPLSEALKHLNVKVQLDGDLSYIVKAYFMNIVHDYKLVNPHDLVTCTDEACKHESEIERIYKEVTNTKKLLAAMSEKNVVRNLVDKVYNKIKADLTQESIQNLVNRTKACGLEEIHAGLTENRREIDGRTEVPDYFSLVGAMQVLQKMGEPILLKVKKCAVPHRHQEPGTPYDLIMYLVPVDDKFVPMPVPMLRAKGKQAVVVVEGKRSGPWAKVEKVADYAKRLTLGFDFLEICELDGAQHKQYTDSKIGEKPSTAIPTLSQEYQEKLDRLKITAELSGCSFENQTRLVLSHIFVKTFENALKDVNFEESLQQKINGCDVLFPVLNSKSESTLQLPGSSLPALTLQ